MIPAFGAAGLTVALALAYVLIQRLTRPSLSKIRGPKSSSFLLGWSHHSIYLLPYAHIGQETCSSPPEVRQVKWTLNGMVSMGTSFESGLPLEQVHSFTIIVSYLIPCRVGFQEDQLLIADPKALQRIFNTSAYRYPKLPNIRAISRMTSGKGIVWAEGTYMVQNHSRSGTQMVISAGEDHKRQRKVLLPGFGGPESKAFLNIFKGTAESVSSCMPMLAQSY